MEFGWSEADESFRREVDAAVALLPPGWATDPHEVGNDEHNEFALGYVATLAERGLLTPHWPVEYGGRAAPPWQHLLLGEAMWANNEPRGPQYMNVNWIGPAIMAAGTDEQKAVYLPPIARGEVRWCQGFSEPEAGSDLASLRTRAERDGDEYVINGQKVWTSYANVADHCFLLARTAPPEENKHAISIFLVPMSTPGVQVRDIHAIVHDHAFHEVFFDDVRVPASCRLGAEGQAWDIIRSTLAHERVGSPRYERAAFLLDQVADWLTGRGRMDDPTVRRRLGEARSACQSARVLTMWVIDERAKGRAPSDRAYVARVSMVEAERTVAEVVVELLGAESLELHSLADSQYRSSLAAGIAAGSFEIQLNLVARGVLRLPKG